MLRQAARCSADPALDPAGRRVDGPDDDDAGAGTPYVSLGWGDGHACRDYGELYAWAEANRVDDSTILDVDDQ